MQEQLERNDRIIAYTTLARRVSLKAAKKCPSWVLREDMVSAGMVGLIEAADRFDETRPEHFVGFATTRIRGAVLDELRRSDLLSRGLRKTARQITKIVRDLEHRGVVPTDQRVADALGVTVELYRDEYAHLAHAGYDASIDPDLMTNAQTLSPRDLAERSETMRRIEYACTQLKPRDALLVALYFRDNLTMDEIGKQFGVTPSRICQVLDGTLRRLRALLEEPVALAA